MSWKIDMLSWKCYEIDVLNSMGTLYYTCIICCVHILIFYNTLYYRCDGKCGDYVSTKLVPQYTTEYGHEGS